MSEEKSHDEKQLARDLIESFRRLTCAVNALAEVKRRDCVTASDLRETEERILAHLGKLADSYKLAGRLGKATDSLAAAVAADKPNVEAGDAGG